MILMQANPLQGPWKGVGPENFDFLGPEMATSEASAILAQKSRDFFKKAMCRSNPFLLV
jgi:hypothetical protein